jgi:hypothetical protein
LPCSVITTENKTVTVTVFEKKKSLFVLLSVFLFILSKNKQTKINKLSELRLTKLTIPTVDTHKKKYPQLLSTPSYNYNTCARARCWLETSSWLAVGNGVLPHQLGKDRRSQASLKHATHAASW